MWLGGVGDPTVPGLDLRNGGRKESDLRYHDIDCPLYSSSIPTALSPPSVDNLSNWLQSPAATKRSQIIDAKLYYCLI